jgi:Protein of unknown function (DUF2851).
VTSTGRRRYAEAIAAGGVVVREDAPVISPESELAIQARWFAGDMGREWTTEDGRRVEVVDYGKWNREPGPDFADVHIRFDDGEERVGPVEIDREARDWERHGHAENPAFRETVLHVFLRRPSKRFFTRTCDHKEVPQVCLDAGAIAHSPRRTLHTGLPVTDDPFKARAILLAAARHRLALKAASLERWIAARGFDEAVFSAMATALGYKTNRTPFLLVAQRAGLATARGASGEAILFGIAGFLESPEPPAAAPETRTYLRTLWEDWWRVRGIHQRWILSPADWTLAPLRPANHPHRRMAALSRIGRNWSRIRAALDGSRNEFLDALESLTHPFWEHRFNLNADRLYRPQALIGEQRAKDMLINIWYPLAVSRGGNAWREFIEERGPAPATVMRKTAARFFGIAADALLSSAAIQQGLIQIDRDDRSASCPEAFRERLRNFDAGGRDSTPHAVPV